jgi:hypothetical protein
MTHQRVLLGLALLTAACLCAGDARADVCGLEVRNEYMRLEVEEARVDGLPVAASEVPLPWDAAKSCVQAGVENPSYTGEDLPGDQLRVGECNKWGLVDRYGAAWFFAIESKGVGP